MDDSLMIVLNNAKPGREDDFNDWYTNEHIVDVVEKLDGFLTAQRFKLVESQLEPTEMEYSAVYRIAPGQVDEAQAAVLMQRAERPEAIAAGRRPLLTVSDSLGAPHHSWFYEPITPLLKSTTQPIEPAETDEFMFVFSNVHEGREDEFNHWYNDEHIIDVVEKLDGFITAQRYELTEKQLEPTQYRYVAMYRIPAGQMATAQASILMQRAERAEALAAGRRPLLTVSDTMAEPHFSWFFAPITGELKSSRFDEKLRAKQSV
jgi:hypothetical protein